MGSYKDALILYKSCVVCFLNNLGNEHQLTLKTFFHLAETLLKLDSIDDSVHFLKKITDYEENLGKDFQRKFFKKFSEVCLKKGIFYK